ncbi:MAG: hypothetical protein A3C80_04040 [Candidatus Ryanbacteria bacterium RIFCSPHIGHO2_02_FULL_45_43]|uniref:DNA 3'-5' helicase n=1 Tax=Candidatus Ryanbacteria bacterium RIFCSPHIGHO2_01_45_13 TaxID=1802112 RepID=A0A1G2FWT8_9BACT|nr:MAG: hypothetical protein A2718_00070 [Candidatus Ryanbacteria bacterium RIFCSPHIGHO2_01_FULL_44_130]OGZ42545.1 MAG: hypothetical protein A2W41_01590 [Candidatus Ryanbacteria bacterium RIFCSPHIGHO2_01_45_13]OGZ48206.1 MAG: hypothetical protein A3C80_04040 [Candidatus Ryanbacteria bacterium RIFCSPHIGHO2_02_FULL_45_43]OGZ49982.1 MAG: hypothetical protein A3E55_01700 [Candidatus Ryanbacteria bacterium RIFCSPHIGHO2_12_FULL_44_20]OGZ51441.1 MAG: hypothetical protein A3A17_01650 [Candidatus Ryanba
MQHFSDILSGLNERQKEAVLTTEGPLLVLAGAGSGKTKVIAHRIAQIIQRGASPKRILAITFTNKAAEEMKIRIAQLLLADGKSGSAASRKSPSPDSMPFVGTFHALGVQILKRHGSRMLIPQNFTILDESDTKQVCKELGEELALDTDTYDTERLRASISRLKNELISAADFARESAQEDERAYEAILSKMYSAYEARLFKTGSLDFDDLLIKTVFLLETQKDVLGYWQKQWDYIHIDEYQDTNKAQYAVSLLLAREHKNIAVVGDIDQAIYSWRGGDTRNISYFERDFPNARVIALEDNYRSTKIILEAAHNVIVHNAQRKNITLRTKNPDGERITIRVLENEKKEAETIVQDIGALQQSGVPFSDIAVLFRTNAQSRAIEEAFVQSAVPYKLVAGVRFYERKEIKDVLSYIRYIANKKDTLALKRIINTPLRGIGAVLAAKYVAQKPLKDNEKARIGQFENMIKDISDVAKTKKIRELLKYVILRAGFKKHHSKTDDGKDRIKNIEELITVADKFEGLTPKESMEKFLEEAALMSEQDLIAQGSEKVHLLTAHAAKGLEFRVVIIAGMEEGLFPHVLSQEEGRTEEERRLFYVALTRAKEKVVITLTTRRMLWGELLFNDPSRFLREIPQHLTTINEYKEALEEESGETIHYS